MPIFIKILPSQCPCPGANNPVLIPGICAIQTEGKNGSTDHQAPEYISCCKYQLIKMIGWSTKIGLTWSTGPVFPFKTHIYMFNITGF